MVQGSEIQKFIKRLAGLTAEVNLRNPFHADEEPGNWGINPGFETQGRQQQKSKTMTQQKRMILLKIFYFKKITKG